LVEDYVIWQADYVYNDAVSSGASKPATYGRFKTSHGTKVSSIRFFLF